MTTTLKLIELPCDALSEATRELLEDAPRSPVPAWHTNHDSGHGFFVEVPQGPLEEMGPLPDELAASYRRARAEGAHFILFMCP